MASVGKAGNRWMGILSCSILLCMTMAGNASSLNRFRAFVDHPIKANYDQIANHPLSKLKHDWRRFQNDEEGWEAFVGLVESGDSFAIDLAVKVMPLTGGGNMGDLCRAVNKNISTNPKSVLMAVAYHAIPLAGFEAILTCLPLETVDDFGRKISETNARLAAIVRVDEPQLAEYKTIAIRIYQDRLTTFKEALEVERQDRKK